MRSSLNGSSAHAERIPCESRRFPLARGVCRHARTSTGRISSIGVWRRFRTAGIRQAARLGLFGLAFASRLWSIWTDPTKTDSSLSWPTVTGRTPSWLPVSPLTSSSGLVARLREVRYWRHMTGANKRPALDAADRVCLHSGGYLHRASEAGRSHEDLRLS